MLDVTPYLAHMRRTTEDARRRDAARAAEARARLPACVALLAELGATHVVLFGSLLGGALHEGSDVDLAVAGLPKARYWEALWRAADAMGRRVDIVPLEEASPSLLARIAQDGEVLHRG